MNTKEQESPPQLCAQDIREQEEFLFVLLGTRTALLRGRQLALVLGYSGVDALRKHFVRGTSPVPLYRDNGIICAHTSEVAKYLAAVKKGSANV